MKTLLILAIYCVTPFLAYSQKRTYNSLCDGVNSEIIWYETKHDEKVRLHIDRHMEDNIYIMDNQILEQWTTKDRLKNHDFTIKYKSGEYIISGIFEGEEINKTVMSKGYPWHQNIAYSGGYGLRNKESFKFECFHPDNLRIFVMEASIEEKLNYKNKEVHDVRVQISGFLSLFWSCKIYFDLKTNWFVLYEGSNGGPGTSETVITLKQ